MDHIIEQSLSKKLNQQQLEMIRLFELPFPEEDYLALKGQIVQLLNKQLQEEMKRLEKERGWTPETYEQWGHDHDRIAI